MNPRNVDIPFDLTGPDVDRLVAQREDAAWLASALAAEDTRFIPVCGTDNVFVEEDGAIHPLFLTADRARPLLASMQDTALLGRFGGWNCFLLALDAAAMLPMSTAQCCELRAMSPLLDACELALLGYARALAHWHAQHRFCGRCGAPTECRRAGHARICLVCDTTVFPRIDPAIIVLVTHGARCLLGHQSAWPAHRYATLAGFVEYGETLESAVRREVFEETNVRVGRLRYLYSQPWPFPGSLMLGFRAEAESTDIRCNDGELEHADWFSRDDIVTRTRGGTLLLSPSRSISYRLLRDWYEEDPNYCFDDLPYVDPYLKHS